MSSVQNICCMRYLSNEIAHILLESGICQVQLLIHMYLTDLMDAGQS